MAHSAEAGLAPGDLWSKIQRQTDHALACGALQPIDTRYEFVEQGGMRFLVRILANLVRKEKADRAQQAQQQAGKPANPFLPYDPDLFVANLSDTHLCLLNKYNVVDHHVLIVTRAFEDQDTWLTEADFEALALGMAEIDGLAFYNGGRRAGASQRHKHLQLVPPPLCPDRSPLPLATVIAALGDMTAALGPLRSPVLPFHHAILPLAERPSPSGKTLLATYRALLAHLGAAWDQSPTRFPYNLLVTREWMIAVARQSDHYQSIPVNSLGFAGSLLVKNLDQLDLLKALGPMTVLERVARGETERAGGV
ncbi:ATP adenylyltransferase family protein [Leptolyngbya sp. KIOST-1]|uniref:ATP adenylyltransferase family protein n=1 Tax=Leptolyngbya sp. KIOST-1 TaxID=1229172 RepID=UPI00055A9BD4|nr:phosphorylase [Leptolyngbya sp. KIOST-1]